MAAHWVASWDSKKAALMEPMMADCSDDSKAVSSDGQSAVTTAFQWVGNSADCSALSRAGVTAASMACRKVDWKVSCSVDCSD